MPGIKKSASDYNPHFMGKTHTMRASKDQKTQRILVLNAKGGCGKTTVATNLACQFANEGHSTALIDYDPQCSSSQWLEMRPSHLPIIHSISAHRNNIRTTSVWHLKVPVGTTRIVVDTPARLEEMTAIKLIREADTVLIPVIASPIDIRAATQFIEKLLKSPELRNSNKRIAVIGNRSRKDSKSYKSLNAFLEIHKLPFLSSLRATQNYVRAAEEGIGVQELKLKSAQLDVEHWHSLVRWIENDHSPQAHS
jgi:chromosome partitioning protein